MLGTIVKEVKAIRVILTFLLVFGVLMAMPAQGVLAATTADISVNATPAFVGISCNVSTYNFGTVAASSTTNTSTSYFGITNSSTVQTDQTISVTTASWSGGPGWTHNDSGTPGDNATAIKANKAGSWGTGDVIVKNAAPNYIAENQTATTDYAFGLGLWAPTVLYDGAEKTITVRISAAQG